MQNDYTILLFDWDDTVAVAQLIRTDTAEQAMSIAHVMALAYPRLPGFQLWHQGRRIGTTYPQAAEPETHPPVAAVVQSRLKRRAL